MKLMRAIHNLKKMMTREFQHCLELQLIEVMNVKMHRIQFMLIVSLISRFLVRSRGRSSGGIA
jgi:hypothetical protein